MRAPEALQILGLERSMGALTAEIVLEAFRSRVKLSHPDTAGESNESQISVQKLTEAKKVLLESLHGTDLCCKLCLGRGMVRSNMGFRHCVACKGTGERR